MGFTYVCVATNVGGNAESVKDDVNGYLVPAEDPSALSAAIAHLLSDPAQAKAMGLAGKALVAERFTTEAMMNRISAAYRNILDPTQLTKGRTSLPS